MSQKQPNPLPTPGLSPVYFILALAITFGSFIAGLAIGFAVRPALIEDKVVEIVVTAAPNLVGTRAPQTSAPANMNFHTPGEDASPASQTIMDVVLTGARHIAGSPNAPVTIVEFSDFQ